jgi:phenylalanyl-tRNA synthetase alpha subunit
MCPDFGYVKVLTKRPKNTVDDLFATLKEELEKVREAERLKKDPNSLPNRQVVYCEEKTEFSNIKCYLPKMTNEITFLEHLPVRTGETVHTEQFLCTCLFKKGEVVVYRTTGQAYIVPSDSDAKRMMDSKLYVKILKTVEYKSESTYKGTRILTGADALKKRQLISIFSELASNSGFGEVFLPIVELSSLYSNKAGEEVLHQMFVFRDKGFRDVCLRPEGTATFQELAKGPMKHLWDQKFFYTVECFRYENPQAGRYRQFTQFGVEWINPRNKEEATDECKKLAIKMMDTLNANTIYHDSVKRGLAYYVENGFEIECPDLGAQKQVCGGGAYAEGVGFAFGIDRILSIPNLLVY